MSLLKSRAHGATICPSEAARAYFGEDSWRSEMERGILEITEKGKVADPSRARGAIRFRLP